MPNNCNSIIKKIFYALILCITVSCSTIKKDKEYSIYSGKLLVESMDTKPVSLNIVINLSRQESIIQLKKPFYGNVLVIKAGKKNKLAILPYEYSYPFYIPDDVNKNFKYWLRQCLLSKNFNLNKSIEGSDFNFICNHKDRKLNFEISYQKKFVSGYLKRK
jgi:hypothetical protein